MAKVDANQRQCLVRAMYFESNRSSTDGMLAVGSVVMNRVKSPEFPDTICGVVGRAAPVRAGRDVAQDDLLGAADRRSGGR